MTADLDGITIVPGPSAEFLNQRQLLDYKEHRKQCLSWLLAFGKDPEKATGYAYQTVRNRANRMDLFYRWVWEQDGYTLEVTHSHADEWLRSLVYEDYSNAHRDCCKKAAQMLFKWHQHAHGKEKWDPQLSFSVNDSASNPRDYLTREERRLIREAALEYGSVPNYSSLTPSARDQWKTYLAQRFDKPKSDVTPSDWERANGWKTPSLVFAGLDGGLRPIEIERAVVSWVDIDNGVLRIPKEQSSKNHDNWIVGLQTRTVSILERWLEERENYPKYADTDQLWLTRQSNPYQSSSLRYLLHRLCEIAGISTDNRQMSWYAVRHSTGTYMTREEDLAAAQAQLRHRCAETTMKYDQAPVEDRIRALDRMG